MVWAVWWCNNSLMDWWRLPHKSAGMDHIASTLTHASAEVRGRALESLEFKWKYGLIGSEDLLQDRRVLRGLLGLLGLGDGPQATAVALLLLRKIAAADTRLARALLELGALQQLQATPIHAASSSAQVPEPFIWVQPGYWPEELLPSVEALARLLMGLDPSDPSAQPALAGAGASSSPSRGYRQQQGAAALRRSAASAASAGLLGSDAAGSPPLVHAPLSSGSLGSAGGGSPVGAGASSRALFAADAAGSASGTDETRQPGGWHRGLPPAHHRSASTGSLGSSRAAEAAAAGAAAAGADGRGSSGVAGAAGSEATALFDERLLRARARADWRQMDATGASSTGVPLYPGDASSSGGGQGLPAGHLTLPLVSLSAADDQALFELNVRLQYSDDARLLLPALLELSGALGVDLPAEALLSRPSILDNCLALVGDSKAGRAVQQAAAAALLQVVQGLKQSLLRYQDPQLASSEYSDAAAAAAAAAAAGGPVPTDLASCLNPLGPKPLEAAGGAWPLAGFREAAKALAAAQAPLLDPSCPNSYPQLLLPDLGPDAAWRLPAGALQGARVDVTAAVASICLQTAELLKHPERHYQLLPLLEEALPLVAAPLHHLDASPAQHAQAATEPPRPQQQLQAGEGPGPALDPEQLRQLQQHMQAIWKGVLAALSRALAACAAVGAADRAAAATASLASGRQPGSSDAAAVAAVAAAVPAAAAAGAAALAAGSGCDGGLCVWDLPSLNLIMLGLRWVNAAPATWVTSSVVPASLADTVAAAAADEAVALVLPQLRVAARQLLQKLRPWSLQALAAAHAVPAAWEAGEEALQQLPLLQQQLQALQQHQQQVRADDPVSAWLSKAQEGLSGLGYAPRWDAKLLQGTLHGLSLVAPAATAAADPQQEASSGSWQAAALQRVSGAMLALLRHHSSSVRELVWQLLQSAVESSAGGAKQSCPAVDLLLLPDVLECVVVEQLSSSDAKPAACTLLTRLLRCWGSSIARHLLPWRAWISSCGGDAAGDGLNAALAAWLDQTQGSQDGQGRAGQPEGQPQGFWAGSLPAVLQDLFSAVGDVRRAAGRQLLQLLTQGCEMAPEELAEYTDDPFKGLLSSGQPAGDSTPASGSSSSRFLLPPDPLTDASASLAAAFLRQDVTNLLAVLANKGLAQELRRSAAEELLALTPDPALLGVMAQPQHLEHIWQLCVPQEDDEVDDTTSRGLGSSLPHLPVGAGDPSGSIFDMQLPIAGLQLLVGLLARSSDALDWFMQQPDRLLQPLLPLVLHSLNSVRKAVGRVLALVLFGHAAQQWSGFPKAAAAAAVGRPEEQRQSQQSCTPLLPPGAEGVLLPRPFQRCFKLPFKVCWLPLESGTSSSSTGGAARAHAFLGAGAAGSAAAGQQVLPPLQQQHRLLVRQLVEQQQVLRAAAAAAASAVDGSSGGSSSPAAVAAAARGLLADCVPVELSHISQRVLAATAANLLLVDPSAVAARCLAAAAAAGSHAECAQALAALEQQLGGTHWGLMTVLQNPSPGWLAALSRLLGTAPITREDQQLWLMVLQLVERLLLLAGTAHQGSSSSSSMCSVATLTQLQLLLQQSVTVWLQQPAAAAAAPRPPLALAAGSASWEALRAQPSSASAAAAVADALGLSGGTGAPAAVAAGSSGSSDATLAVTVTRQALRSLLVLTQATKRHCAPAVGFYQQQWLQEQQEQDQPPGPGAGSGATDGSSGSSASVACYSLSALNPCALIRLLVDCIVGVTEGADYGCRVLASTVLCEVLGALQDAATARQPHAAATAATAAPDASRATTAAGLSAAPAGTPTGAVTGQGQSAAKGVPAAVLYLVEAWICRVLMPVAGRQLPGFTSKALVRVALTGVRAAVEGPLVCEAEWTQAWADIGGTFWLSRLCRDREASIRQLALSLTSQLLRPGRTATQALVTSNWPDCAHRLLRVSGDVCEAHGVRAAALRGLAAAMVLPLDALQPQDPQGTQEAPSLPAALPQQQEQEGGGMLAAGAGAAAPGADAGAGAATGDAAAAVDRASTAGGQPVATAPARMKKLHGFGLAPLLQADIVWQQLLPQLLLKWQQQPPGLTAAAAVLAAVAAAAEPDGVGRQLLLLPGVAAAVAGIAAAGCTGDVTAATPGCEPGTSGNTVLVDGSSRAGQLGPDSQGDEAAAVLRQLCDRLDAAAAALHLLSLAAAPASAGGSMLPLPASVQGQLRAAPAAAAELMCSVGRSLQAQQQAIQAACTGSSGCVMEAGAAAGACAASAVLVLQQQQLAVFRVAAASLLAAAATWPEATRRQQLLPIVQAQCDHKPQHQGLAAAPSSSSSSSIRGMRPGELLCAAATCLAHPACSQELRLACTKLLGLLLSDAQLAAAALGTSSAAVATEAGDEGEGLSRSVAGEAVFGASRSCTGEPIGAVLCRGLASQLPGSIFLPTTLTESASGAGVAGVAGAAAAGLDPSTGVSAVVGSTSAWAAAAAAEAPAQLMVAPPEGLMVVFALQNLLAFSRAAKAAALGVGLHKLLMESAVSMAAAAASAAAPAAGTAAAGGSGGAGGRRTRARWFNTPAAGPATAGAGVQPAAAAAAAPVMVGPSRKGNTPSVAFGRGGGPELPGFTAVAGVRRPAAGASGGTAAAAAGSTPPSKAKAAAGSSVTSSGRRGGLSLRSSSALKARQQQQQQQREQEQPEQAPQEQEQQQQEPAEVQPAEVAYSSTAAEQSGSQGASAEQPAGAPPGSEASQHVSLLQEQLRQQQTSSDQPGDTSTAVAAAGADGGRAVAAPAGGAAGGSGLTKQQLLAASKQLNLRKLLVSVVLLRHLAYGCADTQAALTADGLVDVVLKLWPLALQHTPLLLELTRLLSNALPHCYEARLAATTLPGPACSPVCGGTVLSCLLSLIVGQLLLPQLQQAPASATTASGGGSTFVAAAGTPAAVKAAAGVLLGYASTDDGAATLVKAGASSLPELAKAVRGSIVSARREAEPQQQRQLASERLACCLQLLAVLAGRPEGQRALLRPTVAPVMLELCAEVLQLSQQPAAAAAALLMLRNLSFNGEVRSPLLAAGALLPLLLAAAESLLVSLPAAERQQWQQRLQAADEDLSAAAAAEAGCECRPPKWDPVYQTTWGVGPVVSSSASGFGAMSAPGVGAGVAAVPSAAGNVCCAAYAVSALWALVHNGERVKAALRKLPAAAARLAVVKAHAAQLLQQQRELEQQEQEQQVQAPCLSAAPAAAGAELVAAGAGQHKVQQGSRLGHLRREQQVLSRATASSRSRLGAPQPTPGSLWVGPAVVCAAGEGGWWLQQLLDSCSALLELMDAC